MGQMINMDELLNRAQRYSKTLEAPAWPKYTDPSERPDPARNIDYSAIASFEQNRHNPEAVQKFSSPAPQFRLGMGYLGGKEATPESTSLESDRRKVESVVHGQATVDDLLAALRMMASMEPDAPSNPVMQLDRQYKGSDAMRGIPGTVAQYPTAGGMTRETEYRF